MTSAKNQLKAALTYLVLLSYLAGLVKPVLPILLDVIAHTFQELEHTDTVHKHNGENHVHLEIESANKQENSNKNVPAQKIEVSVNPHLACKLHYDFSIEKKLQDLNSVLQACYSSSYILVDYPPPKSC